MKFYNKRGDCLVLEQSKIINAIFYDMQDMQGCQDNYVFTLQEDKVLLKRDENEILNMSVDIVPNKKLKRMPYNFENFQELFTCLKSNRAIPYVGEDL